MARIRSIKPEYFSSPGIEQVEPHARLLFIAMWCWADDNGVGVANPRELLGFAFPLDEDVTVVDLRRMLVEIRRVFGVKFYTVAGRPYYWVPSWEKHQKFDRRSKGKHPGPDQAETPSDLGEDAPSTESHESTSSPRRDSVAGTGEQGNRGTGEQGNSSGASRRATQLPEDFSPDDNHRTRALGSGLDVDRELIKFRAHAEEKGRTAKSWNAAFTRWLMNAAEFAARDQARGPRSSDRQGDILRREHEAAVAWDAANEHRREIGA